eukprot:TRINITY_DN30772_c0_g1_i1.p2 TRINITY_DN30772_c0_g1~~TRINITY_DN30772_c0_g1_i1.p2  ORF type:complete len:274 (+),score=52.97 TRINITY_DN30772_c0_g1_i1:52-873(+)
MAGPAPPKSQLQAFNFENVQRNAGLAEKGVASKHKKTGTTIVGLVFKGGVVMGSDNRASAGQIVADKWCQKIHDLAPNVTACGAGTAADCDHVMKMIQASLNLHRFETGKQTRFRHAEFLIKRHLAKYQGYIGAHIILGGCDVNGPNLCSITNHGYSRRHAYLTMGSGSLAAQAVLDKGYRDDLTEEEAKDLAHQALRAGIFHDLGSGNCCDLWVCKKGDTSGTMLRPYDKDLASVNEKQYKRQYPVTMEPGTTGILTEEKRQLFEISEPMEE